MKLYKNLKVIACVLFLLSCNSTVKLDKEAAKQEILNTEKQFNDMAASEGVKAAFLKFAADSAVINRGSNVIKGKKAIATYYDSWAYRNVSLSWQPQFVEVAKSGDLGYTYGPYQFSATDTTGASISSSGIFHTVWQKQTGGSWKFVYD